MSIKSELDKTASYLRRARQSIIGRGGEISLTAGLKDLPNAIFNIPADASLAHYTDVDIAYRKNVPVGAEKYALLKSVGGMTRKCTNLFDKSKLTVGWLLKDGSVGVADSGFYISDFIRVSPDTTYYKGETGSSRTKFYDINKNAITNSWDVTGSGQSFKTPSEAMFIRITIVIDYADIFMLNEGSTALPYEPYFEGLRSAPVTEVEIMGKNLAAHISASGNVVFENGVATQIEADTYSTTFIKLQAWKGDTFLSSVPVVAIYDIGRHSLTITAPAEADRLVFGINGQTIDTQVSIYITDLPKGVYTLSANFTNITQGSISWRDIQLEKGTTATPYTPYTKYYSYPIPKAVQALDGYGWGINADCNNYIDREKKQFVKRVEKVVFDGTESWYITGALQEDKKRLSLEMYNFAYTTGGTIGNIICSHYEASSGDNTYALIEGIALESKFNRITIYDENYQDANSFKIHLAEQYASGNPVTVYYELAEPVITDISDILTDDNFIEVESGGSLEFVNEYKYAVPSTVKYTIKVGS